jgi:hypothetical protein
MNEMKMPNALYDLAPSSPALAGRALLFCMDQKSNQKNLAPNEKRRWKAITCFLFTPFFKGAFSSTDQIGTRNLKLIEYITLINKKPSYLKWQEIWRFVGTYLHEALHTMCS